MADLGFNGTDQSWTGGNPFLGSQNPYLQQNINAANQNITNAYTMGTAPQMASRQAASGSFGNSGLDQLQGEQQRQFAQTLGNTDAQMQMQDYQNQGNMYQWDQGFNANQYQQGITNNRNNLQDYMGLLSTANNFGNQDINNANTIYNTPMNYAQGFGNQANSIGNGYGTTTGSTSYQQSPVMGALGGWQLGGAVAKNTSNPSSNYNWTGSSQYF
jgi:hypothetical protein